MAPLLNIIVQLLPSLPSGEVQPSYASPTAARFAISRVEHTQRPIGLESAQHSDSIATANPAKSLSTVSWAKDRLDVFGLEVNNLTHKYWDGHQWNPVGPKLETLGNGLASPPVAVTWGVDRLDIFGLDDHNTVKHQYWEGKNWQPSVGKFENLGGECADDHTVTASTWGPNRLDIFCRGPKGDLLHQYYDGSQWQPSAGALESRGGTLGTPPSVLSWGENRLDIFALNPNNEVIHLYRDGSQWAKWETLSSRANIVFRLNTLTVSSWGKNRLDIFGIAEDDSLWHKYFDGSQWQNWEQLGSAATPLIGSVGVTSWSANRLDIVALSKATGNYMYKFYDGQSWQPDAEGWYDKGGPGQPFVSNPSVISWGENRLDIFGQTASGNLLHQAWTGDSWYPSANYWETLNRDNF